MKLIVRNATPEAWAKRPPFFTYLALLLDSPMATSRSSPGTPRNGGGGNAELATRSEAT